MSSAVGYDENMTVTIITVSTKANRDAVLMEPLLSNRVSYSNPTPRHEKSKLSFCWERTFDCDCDCNCNCEGAKIDCKSVGICMSCILCTTAVLIVGYGIYNFYLLATCCSSE